MIRMVAVLLAALALLPAAAASAQERKRFDTDVFALVQRPGYPAHAYVHPNGRVYAGTYTNPNGDTVPSRVFEYSPGGDLLRSYTVAGQRLDQDHGVQAATSDAQGRLVLLDKARQFATLGEADRRAAVLKDFSDYFGPEANNPTEYFETAWAAEPWSRGGPVGIYGPGTLTAYGPALRQPVGKIHWAGTETSSYWNGYMDGAIRSGERAAQEVLDAL